MNFRKKIKDILRKGLTWLRRISSSKIILFGFAAVILLGAFVLMMPLSARSGESTSFLNALFTATSATCVTGLVPFDTATHWSVFGQIVLLVLIQIGAMGVVTVAVVLSMISGRKIGLLQRRVMQDSISAPQVGGILKLTGFTVKVMLAVELLAAVAMLPVFIKEFGAVKGVWFSVFHSVSAFCNAGFDLMGAKQPLSSLTYFVSNPLVNVVIMFLIVFGGIGFATWQDIRENKLHFRRYKMQTKVILSVSAVLIFVPALYFFFFEYRAQPLGTRFWASLFQSVTIRTAGFSTTDYSQLSEPSVAVMIPLMLIGGSPGSTAGGLKTTTAAVLFFGALSVFRGRENPQCFSRRIDNNVLKQACTIAFVYISLAFAGAIVISAVESLPFLTCLFETASAIGTVGITLGITGSLSAFSKIILIILMFIGRIGSLTLIFAIFQKSRNVSSLPMERIIVG